MSEKRIPDTIYVSTDRQWAKNKTPICTEEYRHVAQPAPESVREAALREIAKGLYTFGHCQWCGYDPDEDKDPHPQDCPQQIAILALTSKGEG